MTLLLLLLCYTEADFRAEYLPAARKLEQAYSRCQAKVEVTVTNDKDDYLGKTHYEFSFDGSKAKFDRTIENAFRRVVVGTPDVSFMILTKDGSTILEHVERGGDKYCFTTVVEQGDPVRAAFAFLGKSLSERLAGESFQIKSVSRDDCGVRLEFADVESDGFSIDGWVRFLPDWRIDRSEFNLKRGDYAWRRAEQVNYNGSRVASVEALAFHADRTDSEKYVVVQFDFGPVPASEFRLSRYGYDDRIGLPSSRVPWVWLTAVAVLAVAAFAILRNWRSQSTSKTSPVSDSRMS